MAVGEHGREIRIFEPRCDQERPARGHGIGHGPHGEAHALESRRNLALEIGHEVRPALRYLALGLEGNAAREVGEEFPVVEVARGTGDRGLPAHMCAPLVQPGA